MIAANCASVKIKELHDRFNIQVLATTDAFNTDFSDPSSFMIRAFKYMMAESELHKIRSRTQAGYVQACSKGYYVNKAPWGYVNQRVNDAPTLAIDREKSFAVKMIFEEYASGASIEEARRQVKAHGFNLKGNSAIQRILSNPTYAGLIKVPAYRDQPERLVKGIHSGIVSEDLYYKAAARLTGHARTNVHSNEDVPLKGVLVGPEGRLMSAGNSRSKSGKHYWYYVQQEDHRHLSANKLHAQMGEILDLLSFSPERIATYERIIGEEIQKHLMSRAEIVARTQKALKQVEDRIALAEERWLLQPTSQASYRKVTTDLLSQAAELRKRLNQLNEGGSAYWDRLSQTLPKLYDLRGLLQSLPLSRRQQFLNLVFDNSLTHDGSSYRTPFLHPMFAHCIEELKQKSLLIVEQAPGRTAYGSVFELFSKVCEVLAA